MYVWKVWLGCGAPWTTLPRLLDVQCHRLSAGNRASGGKPCAGVPHWRLYLGEQGEGEVTGLGQVRCIAPGGIALVPLGRMTISAGSRPWRFLQTTFVGDDVDAQLSQIFGADGYVGPVSTAPIFDRLRAFQHQWDAYQGAPHRDRHATPVLTLAASEAFALASDLIATVARAAQATVGDETATVEARVVADAERILAARGPRELGVAALARAVGVSRQHLARAFLRCARPSPSAWLRDERIRAAAASLLTDRRPVAAVAADLGFSSATNFNRSFQAVMRMTPGRWRAEHDRGCRAAPPG